MKRNTKRMVLIVVGVLALSALALACSTPVEAAAAERGPRGRRSGGAATPAQGLENARGGGTAYAQGIAALPLEELSEEEIDGILFMREEEKLARDVYLTLYDLWGHPTFDNIASSEQQHMDAIKGLIDRYQLADPVAANGIGQFTDSGLQSLYDQLVAQGSQSLADALAAGAAIEEIDILDLAQRLELTDNQDVGRVYQSLDRGSRNHLRAFVSALERYGETYQPQYLDPATFDAIVGG
jgi:hypothetical protein